jgi:hypothetical protein
MPEANVMYSQISREVNVKAVQDGEVITEKLQGDNIQDALKTVHGSRNANSFRALRDRLVVIVTDDEWLSLPGGNLCKGGLNFGIKGVACHDDDNRHIFIHERQRTMLKLSGKDT